MDLNGVSAFLMPRDRGSLPAWRPGDAWLGGGTWLYSEPQPAVRRLIDLPSLGWVPVAEGPSGLEVSATCTIAQLDAHAAGSGWAAAGLVRGCCRALLGSFKVWNMATVGGNLCMALPAGPMTALAVALDARLTLWDGDGGGDGGGRGMAASDFVLGPQSTALRPGELLRAITLPAAALGRRTAMRRLSLTPLGRSGALLIGTLDAAGGYALTVTASTRRPVRLAFSAPPGAAAQAAALAASIPPDLYYDDVHGDPAWRRHVTAHLAEEIRAELAP